MRTTAVATIVAALLVRLPAAQEEKPVPKDSVRVSISGCTKGYIFTVGPRSLESPGSVDIPEGTHLRMNGPKKVIAEIKAHEGSMIAVSGLMKRGEFQPDGAGIGGGVRISPGPAPTGGNLSRSPNINQIFIDVEGWRLAPGQCPSR